MLLLRLPPALVRRFGHAVYRRAPDAERDQHPG